MTGFVQYISLLFPFSNLVNIVAGNYNVVVKLWLPKHIQPYNVKFD